MSINNSNENEIKISTLNVSDNNYSYCNKQFTEELWCKVCDPLRIIEGWTSGNPDIDKFIKDTMYDEREKKYPIFLEWVPFDRFTDIKQIDEGGFAKVYTAIWTDGPLGFVGQDDGSCKKFDPKPTKVALKKLNGSQNMSAKYLNEVYDFFVLMI